MDHKLVLKELKSNLIKYFKERNFKFKSSKEIGGYYVYRSTEYGNELIEVSVIDYKVEFGLCASFMVCYSDVTKMWQNARGLDEEFNPNYTYTVIHSRKKESLSNYTVVDELGIEKWCNEILIPYFENFVCSFFKEFDTLDKVDKNLNSKPIGNGQMAQIRIIVAKLNNNPNFEKLADLYYRELEKKGTLYEYPDVLSYLRNN